MCKFISLILLMWNWKVETLYLITSPCPPAKAGQALHREMESRIFNIKHTTFNIKL